MNESVHDEILRVLGEFLDKKVRFKQLIIGWPQFNQKLSYPALALTIKNNPVFRPFPTSELKRFKTDGAKADILYRSGEYEFGLQLDVWAKTKADRNDLYERLFVALNDNEGVISSCFTLPMPRYHGLTATYYFQGFDMPDEASASIEGEWRLIIRMQAICDAAVRKDREPIILTPTVEVEVTEQEIAEEE